MMILVLDDDDSNVDDDKDVDHVDDDVDDLGA